MFRIRIHVTGLEKLPKDSNYLLVSNHRSNYDPICTWHVLRSPGISFLTKKANLKIPFYGRIIRRCCFYEISRTDVNEALHAINMASDLMKNSVMNVGVYPEGRRGKDSVLGPFHSFVFRAAKQAQVPVVVMTIRGTEKIYRNIPFRHTDVFIDFLKTLDASFIAAGRSGIIGERARNIMYDFLSEAERAETEGAEAKGENDVLLPYKQQSGKQQGKGRNREAY